MISRPFQEFLERWEYHEKYLGNNIIFYFNRNIKDILDIPDNPVGDCKDYKSQIAGIDIWLTEDIDYWYKPEGIEIKTICKIKCSDDNKEIHRNIIREMINYCVEKELPSILVDSYQTASVTRAKHLIE